MLSTCKAPALLLFAATLMVSVLVETDGPQVKMEEEVVQPTAAPVPLRKMVGPI